MARTFSAISGLRIASSSVTPYIVTRASAGTTSAAGGTGIPGRGGIVQPAAAANARAASAISRIVCRMSLSFTRLADVAVRAHAGSVRLAILLVVLAVLVEPVERTAARPDQATNGRTLAGARASAGDRSAGRAYHRARDRAKGAILHGVHGLVTARHLRGRLLVARGDDGLRGDRRWRRRGGSATWSCPDRRRGLGGLALVRVLARQIGNDESGGERRDDDEGHADCGQLPGIVPASIAHDPFLLFAGSAGVLTEEAAILMPRGSGAKWT